MMFSELDADSYRCGNEFEKNPFSSIADPISGVDGIGIKIEHNPNSPASIMERQILNDLAGSHDPFEPVNWDLPYEQRRP